MLSHLIKVKLTVQKKTPLGHRKLREFFFFFKVCKMSLSLSDLATKKREREGDSHTASEQGGCIFCDPRT